MFFFNYIFVSIEINDDLRESETAQDDVPLEKIVGTPHVIIRRLNIFFDASIHITLAHLKALYRPLSCVECLPFFRVERISSFHFGNVHAQVTPVIIRERH